MDAYTLTIKAKEGIKDMAKEQFENITSWKMTYEELTYEELQKYDCTYFNKRIACTVEHISKCYALMAV